MISSWWLSYFVIWLILFFLFGWETNQWYLNKFRVSPLVEKKQKVLLDRELYVYNSSFLIELSYIARNKITESININTQKDVTSNLHRGHVIL